jgi:hypothetical protein
MKNIIYFFILIFFSSCITQKACNNRFPPEVVRKDSIIEKVVYKDTTILIPGERVTDTIKIECDEFGIAKIAGQAKAKTNGKASISTTIKNNTITTSCDCDEEKITIQKLKAEKERMIVNSETIIKPPEVVKEVPVWLQIAIGFMLPFTIIGLLRIISALSR